MRFQSFSVLASVGLSLLGTVAGLAIPHSVRDDASSSSDFIRGVNIGGWLILEEWMNGDVFSGTDASDQYSFDSQGGAQQKLQDHWNSWFTEQDVQQIKSMGLNALRIPIGFWAYDNGNTPYIQGADAYLEKAIGWAKTAGLKVWVDLHGAPGSQNGYDNSGHAGDVDWQQSSNIDRTISVLQKMASKYGSDQYAGTVVGLELVNEPISWGNNQISKTQQFASDAYQKVRSSASNQDLTIIMHDAFMGVGYWNTLAGQLNANGKFGIDTHLYQTFDDADNSLTQSEHIKKACSWSGNLTQASSDIRPYVGEWSPVTNFCVNPDGSTVAGSSCSQSGCQCSTSSMDSWNDKMVEQVRRFVEAQLDTFEAHSDGYFMWAWKGPDAWGFRNGVQRGIIPSPITSRKYAAQCNGNN